MSNKSSASPKKTSSASNLYLGKVNRPEYVTVPEAYLTGLAWNCFELAVEKDTNALEQALVFRMPSRNKGSKQLIYTHTHPETSDDALQAWNTALEQHDIRIDTEDDTDDGKKSSLVLAEAIAGLEVEGAKSNPVVPLTTHIALLQNLRGMTGKTGPADVGMILEQFFQLGDKNESLHSGETATDLWMAANACRLKNDSLLYGLDAAAKGSLLPPVKDREQKLGNFIGLDLDSWNQTQTPFPFYWFHEAWTKLTSEEWVVALPARVWVDWATTVLRLAYGLGFLYECKWFTEISRKIINGGDTNLDSVLENISEVLPWRSRHDKDSLRNIATDLNHPLRQAEKARLAIVKWLDENIRIEDCSFEEAMRQMGSDTELKKDLDRALTSKVKDSTDNTRETILYSLRIRDTKGDHADLYGLLFRKTKRTVFVEPGPDWIAVVASLCCLGPGRQVALGKNQTTLAQMGLKPDRDDLVDLLERAGMARGSADADQGLLVQSAY